MIVSNSNNTLRKPSSIVRIINYPISFDITQLHALNQTHVSAQYVDQSASKRMVQMT